MNGLTLLELLLASVLLAVAVVPIVNATTRAVDLAYDIEMRTRATLLAQTEMEAALAAAAEDYSASVAKASADLGDGFRVTVSEDDQGPKKAITVEAGRDANANGVLDGGEVLATFTTLAADMTVP